MLKTQNRKDIVILIVILSLMFLALIYFTSVDDYKKANHSVLNKGERGTSVIFETMRKLDYPVILVTDKISEKNIDTVQIVIKPNDIGAFDLEDHKIKSWIENGGRLIYLNPQWEEDFTYGKKYKEYRDKIDKEIKARVYSYGEGTIIIGDNNILSNKTMTFNTEGAYWILQEINSWSYSKIEFNEYYRYISGGQPSLWKDIPIGIKFILYQMIIVILSVLYYKGKRFGKTIPLYEEVEREENEYINTVSSLYSHAKAWDIVLNSYYENLLVSLAKLRGESIYLLKDNWVEAWKNEGLKKYKKAEKLFRFMQSTKLEKSKNKSKIKKKNSRQYLNMIKVCEELDKVVEERSEEYWKLDI